jgi:hypothetical protein
LKKKVINHDMKPLSLPIESFPHLNAELPAKQFMFKEADTTTEVRNETSCKNLCFRSVFERTARAVPQQSTKHWGANLECPGFTTSLRMFEKEPWGLSEGIFIDTNDRELAEKKIETHNTSSLT